MQENFPHIPTPYIRKVFSGVGRQLYAPSYFQLEKDNASRARPPLFVRRRVPRRPALKGLADDWRVVAQVPETLKALLRTMFLMQLPMQPSNVVAVLETTHS